MLVSALICALIATAVAMALMAGADTDADQRYRSQAAELAQQDQERLKGLSALQLTDLAPPNQENADRHAQRDPLPDHLDRELPEQHQRRGLRLIGRRRRRLLPGHLAGHLGY